MKKLIIILLCVGIAAVGVAVFLQVQKEGASVADVLPEGAFVYAQFQDVEKNLQQMAGSPLWKTVLGIRYDVLVEKNILRPQQKQIIDAAKAQVSEVLSNPMTKKLLGREIALAVYPTDKDMDTLFKEMKAPNPQLVVELLSGVVLVTRIDPDVQLAELLSRAFNQYGAFISQGQAEYEGEIIRTITLANVGVKFSFVRLKDILVFGVGDKAVRDSIDVYKHKKPPLSRDPQFAAARETSETPAVLGFCDFKMFTALFRSQFESLMASQDEAFRKKAEADLEDAMAKMSGITTSVFSFQPGTVSEFHTGLVLDRSQLSPEYASLYSCPPSANETARFVPKDVLGYQWSNCFDLRYYWKEIKKELARIPESGARITALEDQIGLRIEEDILPALGDEIGGYLSDIKLGGLFPIPKILFFIKIGDKAKTESLLEILKGQAMGMVQAGGYKGVSIEYLNLPLGDVQPGYCFLDDYLLIASSRQLLESSIDASGNKALSLPADPAFQEVDFGLTGKNRSVQFVRVGAVMDKIQGVMEWSDSWMDAQDRKAEAFRKGSEMPLQEANTNIAALEKDVQDMREKIVSLEDEVWNLESKGEDPAAVRTQIEDVKAQIDSKGSELEGERERKAELEKILQEQDKSALQLETRQAFLDEVVNPLLQALRSIKTYGMRMTLEDDILKSSLFIKTLQ